MAHAYNFSKVYVTKSASWVAMTRGFREHQNKEKVSELAFLTPS